MESIPEHRTSPWQPPLAGPEAERAWAAVARIAADLATWEAPDPAAIGVKGRPVSPLAGGAAGRALFFAYAHLARPERGWDDRALDLLGEAMQEVASLPLGPFLFSGFSGVGWVLRHLGGWLFETEEDPAEEVGEALEQILSLPPDGMLTELIAGLAGDGVFFLEGLPGEKARRGATTVVTRLAQAAERTRAGLTWFNPPELVSSFQKHLAPEGYYNLGVSHGVPGVIGFLAAAHQRGIAREKTAELLTGAVSWLLDQRLPDPSRGTFPSWVGPGIEAQPARLAWCYGDAGIAPVLLAAGRTLGREGWQEEALRLARGTAARSLTAHRAGESGIQDASLCHGAAGLAHIFNRLWQATGAEECREAALFWLDETLALQRPGEGPGGYRSYEPTEAGEPAFRDDPGFLTGAAGVGLALLAALSPIAPAWDRVLLLEIPPAPDEGA